MNAEIEGQGPVPGAIVSGPEALWAAAAAVGAFGTWVMYDALPGLNWSEGISIAVGSRSAEYTAWSPAARWPAGGRQRAGTSGRVAACPRPRRRASGAVRFAGVAASTRPVGLRQCPMGPSARRMSPRVVGRRGRAQRARGAALAQWRARLPQMPCSAGAGGHRRSAEGPGAAGPRVDGGLRASAWASGEARARRCVRIWSITDT